MIKKRIFLFAKLNAIFLKQEFALKVRSLKNPGNFASSTSILYSFSIPIFAHLKKAL
jgi:hypothetical protein